MSRVSRVHARAGFTLLELVIALSLTAMATGVAASAIWAARRTSESQQDFAAHGESEARWRALVVDMLRHPPAAERVDRALLAVHVTPDGQELRFLSQGVREPFGTGDVWDVVITQDSTDVVLRATPLQRPGALSAASQTLVARIADVHGLEIAVLEPATANGAAQWRADWPLAQTRPAAVSLQWQPAGADRTVPTTGSSLRVPPPLVVGLDAMSSGATP